MDWFDLRDGVYEPLQPDADGILRSEVFPGLWLPMDALWHYATINRVANVMRPYLESVTA